MSSRVSSLSTTPLLDPKEGSVESGFLLAAAACMPLGLEIIVIVVVVIVVAVAELGHQVHGAMRRLILMQVAMGHWPSVAEDWPSVAEDWPSVAERLPAAPPSVTGSASWDWTTVAPRATRRGRRWGAAARRGARSRSRRVHGGGPIYIYIIYILIYVIFHATLHECLSVSNISELSSRRFSESSYVCPYVCTSPYARVIASATRLSTAFPQPLDTAFCHN